MALQKSWAVKIYGKDGTTLKKTVPSSNLRSNPTFSAKINGGLGECVLDLTTDLKHSPLVFKFDSFGESTIIAHTYIVDIYETDPVNAPTGRRIYRGYISKYEPYLEQDGMEGVRVTCLGLGSLLSKSFFGGFSSSGVTKSSMDPQDMAEDIIDDFNTVFGGSLLSYTHGTSTSSVGTNCSYTFTDKKWLDALQVVQKLSGTNWWWKIDENGLYWLQAKPSSATHTFTFGKNIIACSAPKDAEKVINDVEVRYASSGTYDKSDATSQSTYGTGSTPSGKFSEIISDTTINDATTAQQRGDSEVNSKKDALNTATITIQAQGYDIESIKVGQSCKVLNYDLSCTFWSNNLLIVGLTYDGDTCTVQVEGVVLDFGRELQNYVNTSGSSGTVTGSGGSGSGSGGGGGGGSSSPGFVDRETPSGSVNGSNTSFTLAHTPVSGSEHFWINGILQDAGGVDYSISGTTITTTSAPVTGSILLVSYRTSSGSINFVDNETPSGTVDGSNATFTLAHTPTTGAEHVFVNGLLYSGGGVDYTLTGTSIVFVTPPPIGSVLLVSYRY